MEIRINIANKKVLEILSKIDKKDRRIFIQEAILYFHNSILENNEVYSIVYDPIGESIMKIEDDNIVENKKNSTIDIDFEFNFDEYN